MYLPLVRSPSISQLWGGFRWGCVTGERLAGGPRTMFQYSYFSSTIIQGRYLRLGCQKRRPQITLIEVTPRSLEEPGLKAAPPALQLPNRKAEMLSDLECDNGHWNSRSSAGQWPPNGEQNEDEDE
ncbi:hypothetical protein M5D96_001596 [Drosophila gunungcola]|uniref:Uncharacterized protein n=1 Tax=Drosophila gunungcola TaxID=103775 RepID=A0A9P9YYC6_9MUSC|nr:hypothetical protein M5D96_001596 [Drosophila gunungcola]